MEHHIGKTSEGLPYHNQLNKRPDQVRYMWAVLTPQKEYSGYTWGSLQKTLKETVDHTLKIIDLATDTVYTVKDTDEFMVNWRAHYYDYSYPTISSKKL